MLELVPYVECDSDTLSKQFNQINHPEMNQSVYLHYSDSSSCSSKNKSTKSHQGSQVQLAGVDRKYIHPYQSKGEGFSQFRQGYSQNNKHSTKQHYNKYSQNDLSSNMKKDSNNYQHFKPQQKPKQEQQHPLLDELAMKQNDGRIRETLKQMNLIKTDARQFFNNQQSKEKSRITFPKQVEDKIREQVEKQVDKIGKQYQEKLNYLIQIMKQSKDSNKKQIKKLIKIEVEEMNSILTPTAFLQEYINKHVKEQKIREFYSNFYAIFLPYLNAYGLLKTGLFQSVPKNNTFLEKVSNAANMLISPIQAIWPSAANYVPILTIISTYLNQKNNQYIQVIGQKKNKSFPTEIQATQVVVNFIKGLIHDYHFNNQLQDALDKSTNSNFNKISKQLSDIKQKIFSFLFSTQQLKYSFVEQVAIAYTIKFFVNMASNQIPVNEFIQRSRDKRDCSMMMAELISPRSAGKKYQQNKNYKKALKCYKRALKDNPDDIIAILGLCSTLVKYNPQKQDIKHHLDQVQEYVSNNKLDPSIQHNIKNKQGIILLDLNCFQQAEQKFRHVLKIDDSQVQNHFNLGYLFQKSQRHPEALKYYFDALRLYPKFQNTYSGIQYVLLHSQFSTSKQNEQWLKGAMETLQVIFKNDPRNNRAYETWEKLGAKLNSKNSKKGEGIIIYPHLGEN